MPLSRRKEEVIYMEDKNCSLLLEYLRSILYDPVTTPLDLTQLDAPYVQLGRGLQFLQHLVEEYQAYSAELSKGDLSVTPPDKDNFLCNNLKNLHSNLNHLTWQAKQVANGDYSQHVSYLGEFSDAFNTMISQLNEWEQALRLEAEQQKEHAEAIDQYNQQLINHEEDLYAKAYFDAATGIHNRLFFEERMAEVIKEKHPFTIGYMDLDGLKYVNDHFGHVEGDQYLKSFVDLIRKTFRSNDIFARIGGDEFCLVLEGHLAPLVIKKLETARTLFMAQDHENYSASFSYGVHEAGGPGSSMTLKDILEIADARMYEHKRQNKKNR